MAETKFTKQQEDAIEANGKFTILSAAAGSGKTTVLVERVIRLITQHNADIGRMLIVTFSRASRADFRRKIEKAIDAKIRECDTDAVGARRSGNSTKVYDEKKSRLLQQKFRLKNADISTIDAFMIKLAKERFETLGIPSDAGVCDDVQAEYLHEKAIAAAMDYGYSLPDFNGLVACFGRASSDDEIRKFLRKMDFFFQGMENPEKRRQEMCGLYAATDDIKSTKYYKIMWNDIKRKCDYLCFLTDRMLTLFDKTATTGYETGLSMASEFAQTAKRYADVCDYESLKKHIGITVTPVIGRAKNPKEDDGYSRATAAAVKDIFDSEYKPMIQSIADDVAYLDETKFAVENALTKNYVRVLFDVYFKYQEFLMREKMKGRYFEFSDYEHFALRLLRNDDGTPTELCLALRSHYDYILEDEYQDTSAIQDAVFCALSKENLSDLFVVGDVKQSIYRFRKATPQIFIDKRKLGEETPETYSTMYLSGNFRSDYGILRDVNSVFSLLMNENCGGIKYDENEKLQYRDGSSIPYEMPVTTEITLSENDEARYVAEKIAKMINSGVEIDDRGTKRRLTAGDFCILLRSRNRIMEFYDALGEVSIKAAVKDDETPLTKPEVTSIISLMRVIANPMQEVYLTAAMFGEMFGFSLDEIIDIRRINKKRNLFRLLKQTDTEKAKNFLAALREFSESADILSPDKLIDTICRKTGYYRNISFTEGGAEKRESIRWFIAFAKDWAKTHTRDLSAFLRWTDMYIESGKSDDKPQTDTSKVSIMTIHGSKGLEFPVVFLSDLRKAFSNKDTSQNIIMHPDAGLGIYARKSFGHNSSTLQIRAVKKAILQDETDDEIRLLYVAMTRAEHYLFLTAQNSGNSNDIMKHAEKIYALYGGGINDYATAHMRCFLDWILAAAAQNAGSLFSDGKGACSIPLNYIRIPEDEEVHIEEDKPDEYEWDDETMRAVAENMNFRYPHEMRTKLPVKVSVSLIAKSHDVTIQKPDFAQNEGYTRAEKGTAMHEFAQHCDIEAVRRDCDAEIDRLAAAGLVNRNLLNKKQIMRFAQSEIADLILKGEKTEKERNFRIPVSADIVMHDEAYKDEEVLLQGVMDCVVINGSKVTVIDYKTDNVKSMETLRDRYSVQLELYRMGAKALYATDDIDCIIYSFALGEYIHV